jgi:eukaryotic-like serine/threonine-protein kinase
MGSLADDDVTRLLDPILIRARSRIGTTLREKCRLDVLLGVGGMAAVDAATHPTAMSSDAAWGGR